MRSMLLLALVLLLAGPALAQVVQVGEPKEVPLETPVTMPVWSPDGKYLALSGDKFGSLHVLDVQSGKLSQVAEGLGVGWKPSWSPDGQFLAYRTHWGDRAAMAAMVTTPDGKNQAQVSKWETDLYPPKWGEDGISFLSGDDIVTVDEKGELKTMHSLTGGRGIISRIAAVSAMMLLNRLCGASFTTLAGVMVPAKGKRKAGEVVQDPDNNLWVLDEYGNRRKLIERQDEPGFFGAQESPSGDMVAINGLSGNLYVASPLGGQPIELGRGECPSWSPDGKYLVYQVSKDDGHEVTSSEIWISSRDGKYRERLTDGSRKAMFPSWSPDGKRLAYVVDGRLYYMPISAE